MLGFAIVDARPTDVATAVWLTSRVEAVRIGHTNAVVVRHDDAEHDRKVYALTADRCVVLTPGSEARMPFHHAIGLDAFGALSDETDALQQRIAEAVAAYSSRSRGRELVLPDFPPAPQPPRIDHDQPAQRALATADYVARVWSAWLTTDEQRRRRAVDPRTGASPWIMPTELGSPTIAEFPAAFAERARPEPLR